MATAIFTHIGFTGTQKGLTSEQYDGLRKLLGEPDPNFTVFHHGDCIGADVQAASIAKEFGFYVVSHPGYGRDHNASKRAYHKSDEVLGSLPYLERNRKIVDASDVLIACPYEYEEVIRSGTWSTFRYARKQNKPVFVVQPNGIVMIHR